MTTPNNRLNLSDVAESSLNQNVVVYTAAPVAFEGKLVFTNNKVIQLDVTPSNGGAVYHVYINFDDIVAIATPTLA